ILKVQVKKCDHFKKTISITETGFDILTRV
ncbi:type I methionyl aminopeptidase, partial [Bacillus subtilis]